MDLGEAVKQSPLVFASTRTSGKYFSSAFMKTITHLVKKLGQEWKISSYSRGIIQPWWRKNQPNLSLVQASKTDMDVHSFSIILIKNYTQEK